jgi:ribonucleotide monophosphatase NagD (HAD superfamily)
MPGAGSIVAAIEVASLTKPAVEIGKPGPKLLEEAAAVVGCSAREAVMIGDAPTDVAAARAVGARAMLVLTGVTTPERLATWPTDQRPDAVAADAAELAAALDRLGTSAA